MMGRIMLFIGVVMVIFAVSGRDGQSAGLSGEALFKQHCVACHVDGGNIINPKKTLHKKDLVMNNIKSVKDIVKVMRKPGPGMTAFDEKTISNDKAKEIAAYIIMKFK